MTTDNDEVHGTVIDRDYSSEPESESPIEHADAPEEGASALYPADGDEPAGDAEDAEDYEDYEDDEEDEEDEDEDDGVIVVESSSVVGEDETPGAADDEADETAGPDVTDQEAAAPAVVNGYETAPDAASQGDAAQDSETAPDTVSVAPDTVSGLDAARDAAAPAHAAAAPAHSRVAGDSQFAGDAGLAGNADEIYRRWTTIQSGFVDDPRESVADAAAFLGEVMTTLVANAREREQELRDEWDRDTGLDTEALRIALRRYRGLIDRLASL